MASVFLSMNDGDTAKKNCRLQSVGALQQPHQKVWKPISARKRKKTLCMIKINILVISQNDYELVRKNGKT